MSPGSPTRQISPGSPIASRHSGARRCGYNGRMSLGQLIRMPWFVPAVLLGLGLVALIGRLALGLPDGRATTAILPYLLGLPMALAGLLATRAGAADIVVRRFLLITGLAFAAVAFIGLASSMGACAPGQVCGEGGFAAGWSYGTSLLIAAIAIWGAFRREAYGPRAD
jgi:hypothetical protein